MIRGGTEQKATKSEIHRRVWKTLVMTTFPQNIRKLDYLKTVESGSLGSMNTEKEVLERS